MKLWKKNNYKEAQAEIAEIEDRGHRVFRFNDYHWRVDEHIDLWPSTKKYMRNHVVKKYVKINDIFI